MDSIRSSAFADGIRHRSEAGIAVHNDLGNRRAAFGASVLTDVLEGNGTGRHE